MLAQKQTFFTPAEAAVLTRLSLKAVNNVVPSSPLEAIAGALAKGVSFVSLGPLTLDFRPSWREVTQRIKDLRRAERLVEVDAEVLGGVPVFRATRIPIHAVAELLSEGETPETLRKGYPRLTEEMLRLAPIYAGAYPLRGRLRKRSWRGRAKKSVFRIPLRDAATS
jgi:uncharacterized protein (DUF433 family)